MFNYARLNDVDDGIGRIVRNRLPNLRVTDLSVKLEYTNTKEQLKHLNALPK